MIVLGWRDLARLGLPELVRLRREGKLDRRRAWALLRGAGTYLPAMAAGRVRDEQAADGLASVCAGCPLHTERAVDLGDELAVGLYCGVIGVPDAGRGTCGCLVGITLNGQAVQAAGKTCVAGTICAAGRWGAGVTAPTPPG